FVLLLVEVEHAASGVFRILYVCYSITKLYKYSIFCKSDSEVIFIICSFFSVLPFFISKSINNVSNSLICNCSNIVVCLTTIFYDVMTPCSIYYIIKMFFWYEVFELMCYLNCHFKMYVIRLVVAVSVICITMTSNGVFFCFCCLYHRSKKILFPSKT